MAPPTERRSSFSRRAQYSNFFSYMLGIVGALTGAGFLIASTMDASAFSGLRGAATSAASPVSGAAAGTRIGSRNFLEAIAGYFMAGSQNAELKREAQYTRVKLIEAKALADENRRLKALLGLMSGDPRPVVAARLIGSTSSSTRRFATLDAGSSDGVAIGMPVRSPLGLVGRVLETAGSTSRVLLVTDSESVVPVRRASDGVAAFAQGRADGSLQIRLINLGINPLRKGDALVTSGSGGLYRPGIAIAVVTSLTRDGAIARVLSDPAATELVVVEPMWSSETQATETQAPTAASQSGAAIP
jgi:rod shape-determining protein MreC